MNDCVYAYMCVCVCVYVCKWLDYVKIKDELIKMNLHFRKKKWFIVAKLI